ncbi:MAG: hypothetical protein E7295_14135 [Lachnospiraceae bacterium]|jgi:hypothetical protein|nr:hypothetical protein [Lachnospiraceae bacterium]
MSKIWRIIKYIPRKKKIQLSIAMLLTICLLFTYPSYGWFKLQRQLQRYEKISSPNALYITAGHREKPIYFDIGGIDVTSKWKDSNDNETQATYQDFVFCVAGAYVPQYTLQLAHTENNPFTYTIYEATVTNIRPEGIKNKDYITYTVTKDFPAKEIKDITDNFAYTVNVGDTLYYSIKKDNSSNPICLNAASVSGSTVTKSTYTVTQNGNAVTIKYDGHYLNMQSSGDDAGLADSTYHNDTYSYNYVEKHSEPLYWQATEIPGGYAETKAPFYHEYILRISWDPNVATSTYKDTDIVYIIASPE